MMLKTSNLLAKLDYTLLQGKIPAEVSGICQDNRKIEPGNLFICIKGDRFDSHTVIEDIVAKGAGLLVVERPPELPAVAPDGGTVPVILVPSTRIAMARIYAARYGYPAERIKLIGITGTKGKTTTTHMVHAVLEAGGFKVGAIGTTGVDYADQHISTQNTTPDSYDLQRYLRDMVDAGCEIAVIEVASQAELLHRVEAIEFDYSIFTNIAPGDHIGPAEHTDFADYLRCKSRLFGHSRVAFVNRDDSHWRDIVAGHDCRVYTYGTDPAADFRIPTIEDTPVHGLPGLRFTVGDHEYRLNRPGHFNALNATAAICVGHAFGVAPDIMAMALENLYIPGRLELIFSSPELKVCVDNAHNGYSLLHFFEAVRAYGPQRTVVVFGTGGNRQRDRRFEMGRIAGNSADLSIVTSQHSRYESFATILADIEVGLAEATGEYLAIEDRREAIEYVIRNARPGDFIGITGLGRTKYLSINGQNVPFDDVATALEFLKKYGWK